MKNAELLIADSKAEIGFKKLVPAAGVEPATFRSGGERSNPLSYAGNVRAAKDNTASRRFENDALSKVN